MNEQTPDKYQQTWWNWLRVIAGQNETLAKVCMFHFSLLSITQDDTIILLGFRFDRCLILHRLREPFLAIIKLLTGKTNTLRIIQLEHVLDEWRKKLDKNRTAIIRAMGVAMGVYEPKAENVWMPDQVEARTKIEDSLLPPSMRKRNDILDEIKELTDIDVIAEMRRLEI